MNAPQEDDSFSSDDDDIDMEQIMAAANHFGCGTSSNTNNSSNQGLMQTGNQTANRKRDQRRQQHRMSRRSSRLSINTICSDSSNATMLAGNGTQQSKQWNNRRQNGKIIQRGVTDLSGRAQNNHNGVEQPAYNSRFNSNHGVEQKPSNGGVNQQQFNFTWNGGFPNNANKGNNFSNQPGFTGEHSSQFDQQFDNNYRGSAYSVDSSMMPGQMSATVSRKRRSITETVNSIAEVAAFFYDEDLSDLEEYQSNHDDDSHCTGKTIASQQSYLTKRSSGASTTGFSRLSINHNQFEERPRKRRSSTSTLSRMDESVQRSSIRGSLTTNHNLATTTYNIASAIQAADQAAQRLSETMHPDQQTKTEGGGQNIPRKKFERRAGFVVSTCETDAAAALASRTELLKKDRYEKIRRNKIRPIARRSMSYSNGARMSSSIIASSMPEHAESIMEDPVVNTDLMNLARNRMERRVLSLPDQNAVARLSQTTINDDVDFSTDTNHTSSSLSYNLEASAAALRRSYKDGSNFHPSISQNNNFHTESNYQPNLSYKNNFSSYQQPNISSNNTQQNFYPNEVQSDVPSLDVTAEILKTNEMAAESLAQTYQSALAVIPMLQEAEQNLINQSQEINASNPNHHFEYEAFDGKTALVEAVEPDTPEEVNISELIHEAARNDNPEVVDTFFEHCKEALRTRLSGSEGGDTPLHVAVKNNSHNIMKSLIEKDPKSALIKNMHGYTPLHIAAEEGNLPAVIALCRMAPQSATRQCEEGLLPLHIAVSSGARHPDAPQITTSILQAFVHSTKIETDEGLLAIHLASISGFTAGIRTLLAMSTDTVSVRESTELKLPLDFAVDSYMEEKENLMNDEMNSPKMQNYKNSIDLILSSILYNRFISNPHESGNHPFLPLHGAAIARPTLDTWQNMMGLYENHQLDVDSNGYTVTHILCMLDTDRLDQQSDVIAMMNDETFTMRDNEGFLPLHRSLQCTSVPLTFINSIVTRNHTTITEKVKPSKESPFNELLPIQIASLYCNLDVIYYISKSTFVYSLHDNTE